jgi:epoxyqueuosine reductase
MSDTLTHNTQESAVSASAIAERAALSRFIRESALSLGFDLVGLTRLTPSEHAAFYHSWLDAGRHGSMSYLAREDAVRARTAPQNAWPGVRSAVVVALHYAAAPTEQQNAEGDAGIFARYARGRDYHKVIKSRLIALLERIENVTGRELPLARAYVDTGPVFERELARRAGIGWFGRNTMLINPRQGSWFFLGTLLLDFDIEPDEPFDNDHCGTCSNCVSACPTGALLGRDDSGAPVMDATRCISYLTIENRGPIPRDLRPLLGNRIFGCDICNEVCPWNGPKFVTLTREPDFTPRAHTENAKLIELMAMDDVAFDLFTRGSPIRRAKRAGLLRNVAVALGNARDPGAIPVLASALEDAEPLVRGHAAWALGRIGTSEARTIIAQRRNAEADAWVREEMENALLGEYDA